MSPLPSTAPSCSRRGLRLAGAVAGVGLITIVLWGATAWGRSAAGAATSSDAAFCRDSPKLQGWLAQDEQPGLDQYDYGPGGWAVAETYVSYLTKLAAEAPPAIHAEMSAWATFTTQVGDRTSQTTLGNEAPYVTASIATVQAWIIKDSGCNVAFVTSSDSPGWASSHRWWIIGGVALLLVVLTGAVANRATGGPPTEAWSSGPPAPAGSGWQPQSSEPERRPCPACYGSLWGPGQIECPDCHNVQSEDNDHPCVTCGGLGHVTCPECKGRGYLE